MIKITNMYKHYLTGSVVVKALDGVNLQVNQGEMIAIIGPSGSGKSTLMNMLGCLDVPSGGEYYLDGVEISSFHEDKLAEFRNQKIGFIFQSFNLLANLTARENVELPLIYRGLDLRKRHASSEQALNLVGLGDRMHHKPFELSGGQQQRVAIARALAGDPPIILADEPTGNLDSKSGREVIATLKELHQNGKTVILITHDLEIAAQANRIIRIQDGTIVTDGEAV